MTISTIESITSTTPNLFSAHYSEFVRSKKNLRDIVEREELLAQIKADKGVKIPGYVYSESHNIQDPETGKSLMVIYDMNSRHWCLEQLENDEEYKKAGGSFELPYLILPDEIANDPVRERLFMVSLGTSNKQLSPKEIGRGYIEARDLGMQQLRDFHEGWESLSDEEKALLEKKFTTRIINTICKESGKSKQLIYQIFRVFDASDEFVELAEALENNQISVSSADELIKVSEKTKKPVEQILNLAEKSAFERGNAKVSDKDIEVAAKISKHPEMTAYIENGTVSTRMFDEVLNAAKASKTPVSELISHCAGFGGVTKENLDKVVEGLVDEEDVEEVEEVEEDLESPSKDKKASKESVNISKSEVAEAKDYIKQVSLELSNFILKDLDKTDAVGVISIAEKLEKAMKVIEKHQS
jgi:hypothetical protein